MTEVLLSNINTNQALRRKRIQSSPLNFTFQCVLAIIIFFLSHSLFFVPGTLFVTVIHQLSCSDCGRFRLSSQTFGLDFTDEQRVAITGRCALSPSPAIALAILAQASCRCFRGRVGRVPGSTGPRSENPGGEPRQQRVCTKNWPHEVSVG